MNPNTPPTQHLAGGIITRTLLVTAIVFLLTSMTTVTVTSYQASQQLNESMQTRFSQLLDTVESTLKIACFVGDEELAREVAQGLLSNSELMGVHIRSGEHTLAELHRKVADAPPSGKLPASIAYSRDIASPFDSKFIIGQVIVDSNPSVVETMRQERIELAIRQTLLQLGFVSVLMIGALIFFIVRPIRSLALRLNVIQPEAGERLSIPPGHAGTEIGTLVNRVNELSGKLVQSIHALEAARLAAEAASEAKAAFLANMSHEIRTPINAVLGVARIGYRDTNEPESRAHFQQILDSGGHLLGVINDVLDFSKIEAQKFVIENAPFRLGDALSSISSLAQPLARQKALDFVLRCPADLADSGLQGDRHRLQQILVNLLSNALKFTSRGRVELAVHRAESEIVFSVKDTGIGISDAQMARLFTAFEQADGSTTRRFGGTGLGLAISQRLAGLMGGAITVRSQLELGSTFTLSLPLQTADYLPEPKASPVFDNPSLRGLRLLVAEDVDINRYILADLIDDFGGEVTFAENGCQAVEAIRREPNGFSAVLMDVQMPEMDGFEATREIAKLTPEVPVIGLTAHAFEEERQRCLEAGMVDRVTKPFDPDFLVATILRWTHRSAENPADHSPAENGMGSGLPTCTPSDAETPPENSEAPGLVDWQAMETRYGSRPDFIRILIDKACQTHAELPAELRRAAAAQSFPELQFLAHKIKGAAGNFFARTLVSSATTLEQSAAHGEKNTLQQALAVASTLEQLLAEIASYRPPRSA